MLNIVRDKPTDKVSSDHHLTDQIDYMLKYLETNFGERALNGDVDQLQILTAKIKQVEAKLEIQRSRE